MGVGLVCYLYGFLLDGALAEALAWPLAARVGLTLALVAPLGMLLGTCFPSCLRLGGVQHTGLVPWLWAVNGFFSVLGSVGAVALGMEWGASASLAVGAAAYVAVGALLLVALLWYAAFSFIGMRAIGAQLLRLLIRARRLQPRCGRRRCGPFDGTSGWKRFEPTAPSDLVAAIDAAPALT